MSRADEIYRATCLDILENGFYDTDLEVRPRWEDGTPAHTVKKFGVVNRYDLQKEFPALTLRKTAIKSAVDEVLWIWQKKSNNIKLIKRFPTLKNNTQPKKLTFISSVAETTMKLPRKILKNLLLRGQKFP